MLCVIYLLIGDLGFGVVGKWNIVVIGQVDGYQFVVNVVDDYDWQFVMWCFCGGFGNVGMYLVGIGVVVFVKFVQIFKVV